MCFRFCQDMKDNQLRQRLQKLKDAVVSPAIAEDRHFYSVARNKTRQCLGGVKGFAEVGNAGPPLINITSFVCKLYNWIFVYDTASIVLAWMLHCTGFDLVPGILLRLFMPCVKHSNTHTIMFLFWDLFLGFFLWNISLAFCFINLWGS